jgi:hypothetical protein
MIAWGSKEIKDIGEFEACKSFETWGGEYLRGRENEKSLTKEMIA